MLPMSGKSILPMLKSKKESIIDKSEKYHYQPAKTKKLSVLFFQIFEYWSGYQTNIPPEGQV